jgi:hypothetical protein
MARLQAEILPVGRSGAALPVVNHNGTAYVVAEPGMEWKLKVKVLGTARKQLYRVRLHLGLAWRSASSCCAAYSAALECSPLQHCLPHAVRAVRMYEHNS